jgi:hypothetical protein
MLVYYSVGFYRRCVIIWIFFFSRHSIYWNITQYVSRAGSVPVFGLEYIPWKTHLWVEKNLYLLGCYAVSTGNSYDVSNGFNTYMSSLQISGLKRAHWSKFVCSSFLLDESRYSAKRDTQIPNAGSPGQLHLFRWRLIFVGPHYGACFVSRFWPLEFWGGF